MNSNILHRITVHPRQSGVTLIVAVILLLLLSIIVLLATNIGLQEQRVSGNDFRAKMAHHAAEAGLNYGGEYFKQNVEDLRDGTLWQACPTDGSFPCGVFQNTTGLFRFVGDLPFSGPITAGGALPVGDFTANVRVGAVMCRLGSAAAGPGPLACDSTFSPDGASVISIVSNAGIAGESAAATLVQSITSFSKLNSVTGVPPIAASGSVEVGGSLDLVTNPNSGGFGVPVSVWTRRDVTGNGTPNTCYLDEFVRFGSGGGATPRFCNSSPDGCSGDSQNVIICDACRCDSDHSISFNPPGGGGLGCAGEGIDILDIDGDCGPNTDVVPSEFPCDLFEFIFGVRAREDRDGDFFCETLITATDSDGNTRGIDEIWLEQNANIIIPVTVDPNNPRHRGCAALNAAASGLVWVHAGKNCNANQVGTVDKPVVLVVDGQASFQGGFRLFGLLFVRALGTQVGGVNVLDPTTGGNATLNFNGRGAIYGAAVVQGQIGVGGAGLTGTAAFIHNDQILRNLINSPEIQAFGTMPGSWTDRFSY